MPSCLPLLTMPAVAGALVLGGMGPAHGATLERALVCGLTAAELKPMMATLAAEDAGFAKPAARRGMPTLDLFKLTAPVEAHGHSADEVVVAPGRIALVIRGTTPAQLAAALRLSPSAEAVPGPHANPFAPWQREVQPGFTHVVAYASSHQVLAGAALLGCQYAHRDAAPWPMDLGDIELLQKLGTKPSPPKKP